MPRMPTPRMSAMEGAGSPLVLDPGPPFVLAWVCGELHQLMAAVQLADDLTGWFAGHGGRSQKAPRAATAGQA